MRRKAILIVTLACAGIALLLLLRMKEHAAVPASWTQLQRWMAAAQLGELCRGNAELARGGGVEWVPVHGQTQAMRFLYSDSPEFLYNASLGKALARMRLTEDAAYLRNPQQAMPFGVGINHTNHATNPATGAGQAQPVGIRISLAKDMRDGGRTCANNRDAVVTLCRGAYGLGARKQVYAGKQCAVNWFAHPNVPTASLVLHPGESRLIFTHNLPPHLAINGRFELTATNAYFITVAVVFGAVSPAQRLAAAPYEMTIGTNSGTGDYWQRTLQPTAGTPAFDAADTSPRNKVHFRFYVKGSDPTADMQYLVDESWDERPESLAKAQIRRKGGQRRPFKGDYNVDYTVSLPVRSSTGKPARFALFATQRYGLFAGAAKLPGGQVVEIPKGKEALLQDNAAGEGVLLDRAEVSSRTPTEYRFHWMLPGGSYGDQEFMLVPMEGRE